MTQYFSDPPKIMADGVHYPDTDWIFCTFDCVQDNYGDTELINIALCHSVKRSKGAVTKHINQKIRYYSWLAKERRSAPISLEYSYVKCINLRDNRFFNVSYRDWLDTKGNYELFEPKPKEVNVDEW